MKKIITLCVGALLVFSLCACDDIGDLPHPSDEEDPTTEIEPGPEEEPEHTHEYGDWEYDDTYHWKECECGEIIDKEEHTLEYTEVDSTYHKVTCDICGYESTSEHTWVWEHDEEGHWQVCSICGETTTAVSHELSYTNEDSEYHIVSCDICGYETTGEHTWVETSSTPATCTEDGTAYYECEFCHVTKTTTIAALGHNWSSGWSHDSTNHWHVCTVCGEVEPESTAAHSYGDSYLSDGGSGHYQVCAVCGYLTLDEAHSYAIVEGSYTESNHTVKCSVCGYVTTQSHTYDEGVVTAPTCTKDGYTTYTCSCGYSYTGNETNALGHSCSSWTDNGSDETHTGTCTRCGNTITEEHDYEVISVSNITIKNLATGDITATYAYTCSVCGHNMTAEGSYTLNFANDPWEIIDQVSTAGYASTYYNIGDTKTITIDSEMHDIRIIDFDHDTLSSNSSSYNNGSNKAAITVEMTDSLSTRQKMNSSTTNSGGWNSSDLRSYLNSDKGCVFSTLDSDLQSVIKKVDKKATKGQQSTSTTTSSDSLFLLALVELNGTTTTGYVDEGTQYAYYSEHSNNSDRIKNLQDYGTFYWWLRSPHTEYSATFRYVGDEGRVSANDGYASYLMGVSFCFCI